MHDSMSIPECVLVGEGGEIWRVIRRPTPLCGVAVYSFFEGGRGRLDD